MIIRRSASEIGVSFFSCQPLIGAAFFAEWLVAFTPDLLRKSAPEGLVRPPLYPLKTALGSE